MAGTGTPGTRGRRTGIAGSTEQSNQHPTGTGRRPVHLRHWKPCPAAGEPSDRNHLDLRRHRTPGDRLRRRTARRHAAEWPRSIDFDSMGNLLARHPRETRSSGFDLTDGPHSSRRGNRSQRVHRKRRSSEGGNPFGPKGISVAPNGEVYLADTESHSDPQIDTKSGILTVVAGTGTRDGPDGPPSQCQMARPHGIWVGRDGTLLIGDSENHRVRIIRPSQ